MTLEVGVRLTAHSLSARVRTLDWQGRAPYILSGALALVVLAASAGSLLFPDALRGPAVTNGQLQGTALVLLVVTIPILAVSLVLSARGTASALIFWLGALGSIAYQAVLFVFGTPFNALFFLYVGMLALSIWTMLVIAWRLPVETLGRKIGVNAPVRVIAAYLVITLALFLFLWLRATVPAILSTAPPVFLEGTGMTTGPVQVMDLGFTLPLMALGAYLLVRRRPAGYILSGSLLVMLAIETVSIAVDQWLGHAADPASPAASVALVPVFSVVTVVGLGVLALFLRPGTERHDARLAR